MDVVTKAENGKTNLKKLLKFLIDNETFSISLDNLINSRIFETHDEIKTFIYETKMGENNFCIIKKLDSSEHLTLIPVNI